MDKEESKNKQRSANFSALAMAGQLGFIIALPLVLLALLGRWLDQRYNASPLFLLLGVLLALVVTVVWFAFKAKAMLRDLEKQTDDGEKMTPPNLPLPKGGASNRDS